MKNGRTLLISFSLLALAGAPAYANEAAGNKEVFNKLDKDGDGMLGRAEAAADADAKSRFERLDTSGDQKLSRDEYQAWSSASAGATAQPADGAMKASALLGKKVVGAGGEELGEINDVVINLNGGKVHAAVLEFGGILGMGEKQYAFPVSQLKPGSNPDKLVLDIDKQKLKDAKGFAKGQWPAMNDEYWGRVGGQTAGAGASTQARNLKLVRASDMIGKELKGKSGNDVGEIKDLTISLKEGSVRNVIVDVKDAGQATLQASALTSGTGGKLLVNMTDEQLKSQAKQGAQRSQAPR